MADDMGERTENATPKRLADARKRGQVARSTDVNAAVGLAAALILLLTFGRDLTLGLARLLRDNLDFDRLAGTLHADDLWLPVQHSAVTGALLLAPLLAIILAVACVTQLTQVGLLFTTRPLKPRLSQLNPISGFKKIFGLRGLVKAGVNVIKLIVVMLIAWLVVSGELQGLAALPQLPVFAAVALIGQAMFKLAVWLIVSLLVLAAIDLIYQKWQHKRDLRMTRQEVKDERRSMEGDPQIKGKRLRMAREIAMQRIAQAVPKADVIIANPTHFSVAVAYDEEKMDAPTIVAKGADHLALRIRHIARIAGVPVIERPPLARALYWGVEIGQQIAPEHYEAVAEVLAYVYRLEHQHTVARAAAG
ncbi:MAG: flagellar biosynthesis protein FlhB [Leptolyngbya sp. PLA3]|nr:MAG: flagellar biosynthesis protein FlhB [Cyanobacteria bacterium CYA]MCE7968880.1 flagellar biosynthesis protein FlhB [Leptolyngbya sp. PL-A3]